eukprot:m.195312 g.195312  ORF g.195312 m.195312 type:complete len:99 (+) comp17002_c0_seq2:5103-5399(+)
MAEAERHFLVRQLLASMTPRRLRTQACGHVMAPDVVPTTAMLPTLPSDALKAHAAHQGRLSPLNVVSAAGHQARQDGCPSQDDNGETLPKRPLLDKPS